MVAAAVLAGCMGAWCGEGRSGLRPASSDRFRGVLYGLACAHDTQSAQHVRRAPQSCDDDLKGVLDLGRSLVREGGFDWAAVRRMLGRGAGAGSAQLPEGAAEWMAPPAASPAQALLRVCPAALAYHQASDDGLRAAAQLAASDGADPVARRAAGRALFAALGNLLGPEPPPRREILRKAAAAAGAPEVEDEILRVHSDMPFPAASQQPGVRLAAALRAWYDSTSYEDALRRVEPGADPAQRRLVGALAGATYGAPDVLRTRWAGPRAAREIESVAAGLVDLAGDGVLVPVPEVAQDRAPTPEASAAEGRPATPPQPVRRPRVPRVRRPEPPRVGADAGRLTAADVPLIGPVRVPPVRVRSMSASRGEKADAPSD